MTRAVNFTRYSNKTWGNIAGPRTLIGHVECRLKFFFLNVGLSLRNSTFNSNSGDDTHHGSYILVRPPRRDTTICADSFYFRFGFSPVENICFRLELVFSSTLNF